MFNLKNSKVTDSKINQIVKESKANIESDEIKRIKSLLLRKDVLDLDNDKVDAIRMLLLHLEDKKNFKVTNFVKYLKR